MIVLQILSFPERGVQQNRHTHITFIINMQCALQDIADVDPLFLEHEAHLKYRYKQFLDTKAAIEGAEGSLADFAKVHCPSRPDPARVQQFVPV